MSGIRGAWSVIAAGLMAASAATAETTATTTTDRVGLTESRLRPAEKTTETPPNWAGDFNPHELSTGGWPSETPVPEASWVTDRFEWRKQFVQPLLLSPLEGIFLARLVQMGGWNRLSGSGELDQFLHLSAGWAEVYAPVFTLRENSPYNVERFRVNLRVPARIGTHHVVAAELGTNLPTNGRLVDDGGFTTKAGYAFGSRWFSGQARAGFGYDQLIGDFEAPLRSSIFYDAVVALLPVSQVQVIMQVDGQRYIGERGNVLRLWPGVRLFPLERQTFSVGLGAQLWFRKASDDWAMRRAGGFVDFGWTFL